ncbi:hypothetical protein YC2023_049269 [Brassica napus]
MLTRKNGSSRHYTIYETLAITHRGVNWLGHPWANPFQTNMDPLCPWVNWSKPNGCWAGPKT